MQISPAIGQHKRAAKQAMNTCSLTLRYGHRAVAPVVPLHWVRKVSSEGANEIAAYQQAKPESISSVLAQVLLTARRKRMREAGESTMTLRADSVVPRRREAWTNPRKVGDQVYTPSQQYSEFRRFRKQTQGLGSTVAGKRYVPSELITNPAGPEDVTLEMLMAAQTHMGHATSLWNPANSRYIYGTRQGIHIISLEATAAHLRRAARLVEGVSYNGGLILFVGTRKGHMEIVTRAAELSRGCHLFTKWTPGAITNRDVILQFKNTKVINHMDNEIKGFDAYKNNARPLTPDLVVCLNPLENFVLLQECSSRTIPTIGIVDTNVEPSWMTYGIPANDDSLRSVAVIAGVLGRAAQRGNDKRLREAAEGIVPWDTPERLRRHMQKEITAAILKKKEVKRMLQEQGRDVPEDEDKLLRNRYDDEMIDVNAEEMDHMLNKASMGMAAPETTTF